jgi:predicted nucleic acid-binding protein
MKYFDTSALIKHLVEEAGANKVTALMVAEPRLATSRVAYVEVHAALARMLREGLLTHLAHQRLADSFDLDWLAYIRVDVVDGLLSLVRELVRRHPLRGFDAVHLASAIIVGSELGEPVQFVASDHRLLAAAKGEGLPIVDVRA